LPSDSARSRRWWIRPLVSLGLYAFIFYYWVDVGSIVALLGASDARYVLLAVVVYCGGQLVSAWRWWLLLGPVGLAASYAYLAGAYFVGMFFNIFLPTIIGGDAVKVVLLARKSGAPARAAMSVFMDRNVGLLALLVVATVAAWFAPPVGGVSLVGLTLVIDAGYVVANLVLLNARAYGLVDRLIARTPLARLRQRAADLYQVVAPYKRSYGTLGAALALSFLHQAVVIAMVFLNARALGQTFPLSALAVFVPLVALAGMLPLTVNGIGIRDVLYILLFGQVGASRDLSLSLALLYLAVTFMASLPGGIVYALQKSSIRRTMP
jgi:hypothetical protein